jgi:hypothetical protein
MINLTDQDILLRLQASEDAFVERKTASDSKDWLKTVVAFANTAPVGDPAILFIGVRNNGEIEGNANLDSLQRTLSERVALAYPEIYYLPKALQKDGKQFLAVIIPGSADRPHFAGPAYVRDGSQSVVSSTRQFDALVAERNGKAREILKWKGKTITVRSWEQTIGLAGISLHKGGSHEFVLDDCNQFFVTIANGSAKDGLSLASVEISHDFYTQRLRLEFRSL